MKSKLLVFLALATVLAGCGDKDSDTPRRDNAEVGDLDNVNPYEVPRNAMSFQDSQELWTRARRAEKVIPAGEAYLRSTPDSGRFQTVTSADRQSAQRRLNNEGRRFADMMNRVCDVDQPRSDREQIFQTVGGNRCPIQSQYKADIARDGGRYSSTISNTYTFNQDLSAASGVASMRSTNYLKRDRQNEDRRPRPNRRDNRDRDFDRSSSSVTYGRAEATIQYTDGERVYMTTRYEYGRGNSDAKMVTEVHTRRGVLRVVIIEGRQATINGQTVDYNKALMGYMPRLSVKN